MNNRQKENLVRVLKNIEERIDETVNDISTYVQMPDRWNANETIASYTARLNGYVMERRGICTALVTLGYEIVWDKSIPDRYKIIDIKEDSYED